MKYYRKYQKTVNEIENILNSSLLSFYHIFSVQDKQFSKQQTVFIFLSFMSEKHLCATTNARKYIYVKRDFLLI